MINFSSKYFTLLAVVFLIFIGYQNTKEYRKSTSSTIGQVSSVPGMKNPTFTYTIDPNIPEKDMGFFDKFLLNMVNKRIPATPTNPAFMPQQNPDPMRTIKMNDQVKLIYKPADLSQAEPDPIIIVLGSHQLPEDIEAALIGLKVGDTRMVEVDKKNKKYTRIEILAISSNDTPK